MSSGRSGKRYDHFKGIKSGTGAAGIPAELRRTLNRFSPAELRSRLGRLEKAKADLGFHYAIADSAEHDEPAYDLDLAPLVLPAKEWETLSAGIVQRTLAFNHFIKDIYGPQNLLRERAVPYPIVLRDPAFLREIAHLPASEEHPLLFGAVDLCRDSDGKWIVLENHYALPFGVSYALQNRRMLSGAIPEIFRHSNVHPVAGFSTEMIEALRGLTPKDNPKIVLLTDTASSHAYFEESFLGRRMGIAIVQPEDLLVRESRVFLKTVGGLEPVDVIYRRIRSTAIDPVSFGSTSGRGIPGLLSCLRKKSVVIANSLGCGIADNKAVLRYSDVLIRYYLHEDPILKTAPTYDCGDPDQSDYVRRNRSRMIIQLIQSEELMEPFLRTRLGCSAGGDTISLLDRHPEYLAARPSMDLPRASRFTGRRFTGKPYVLRCFILFGDRPRVLPGGLCLQSTAVREPRMTTGFSGSKDVWVEASQAVAERTARRITPAPPLNDYHIGSRAAESLYWIGRYVERAENTARMLNVLEEVRWEELGRSDQEMYWPLWLAVAGATGQSDVFKRKTPPSATLPLSRKLILDRKDPASVLLCLRAARNNAQFIREFMTPEVWRVLSGILASLEGISPGKKLSREKLRETCQFVVDRSAQLQGTAYRTMPHDEGWRFYQMGRMLERGLSTISVMDNVLSEAIMASSDELTEDPDLTALLRILSSLDAYRREFRSRAYVDRVAELLWKNEETPSSVAYCTESLRRSLQKVFDRQTNPLSADVLKKIEELCRHIRGISCGKIFPYQMGDPDHHVSPEGDRLVKIKKHLEEENAYLEEKLAEIHRGLEDTYFSHLHILEVQLMAARMRSRKTAAAGNRHRKGTEPSSAEP